MNPWLDFYPTAPRRMIINPFAFPIVSGSPSYIAGVSAGGSATGVTTVGNDINTTGTTVIFVLVAWYSAGVEPVPTDSKSNTYTSMTTQSVVGSVASRLYRCIAPTVGSGHNFTANAASSFASIAAIAVGANAFTFDLQNGNNSASAGSIQPGTITPSGANSVVVCGVGHDANSSATQAIDSGYTAPAALLVAYAGGNHFGCGLAYKFLTTSAGQNPTWSNIGGSATCNIVNATY